MDQEHDGVETGEPVMVTGDQPAGLPDALAEGEGSIRVADEVDVEAAARVLSAVTFTPRDPAMLLGEARDHVLGAVQRSPAWAKLGEKDQRYLANEVEQACRQVIRGAYRATAAMELDTIEVTIKDPGLKSEKEQIEAKIIMDDDAGAWMRLREQSKCTLVFADVGRLMGARAAAVMKDQPGLFPDETPEQRATREAVDRDAAEQERLLGQFQPTDEATTAGGAAAKVIGDLLPPAVKAAADRGRALRLDGGACKIPADLEGKPAEVNAFLKAWEAADREGGAPEVEAPAPEAAEPAKKPKRGGRPKGTSAEERVARNLAAAGA